MHYNCPKTMQFSHTKNNNFTNQFKSFRTSFVLLKLKKKEKQWSELNKAWENASCAGETVLRILDSLDFLLLFRSAAAGVS